MKKVLAAIAFAAVALVVPAQMASADPSAKECHSITVTVNGENVVDQAGCNVLPPQ
ncbi:MAG TPA: hypothetical protein VGO92_01945 [Acidimicrobiales bacterium]|nr:hypothetical protein [Acidimicrobiales bacterium]